MAVASESPQMAATPAHPATLAMARPPGSLPSHSEAEPNRSLLMPAYRASSPMRMNMGMTDMVYDMAVCGAPMPIMDRGAR